MPDTPLTIKRLTVRDVLRVSVVEITPDGHVVTLGGRNGSGKSSVLNAIEMALAGLRAVPPRPIRKGAERGEVVVDLGDLVVERTFTASGSDLVVKAKDGARYPKPQAMLDALFASVAFDPLAFAAMEPPAQAETLRRVLGLDLSALDRERDAVFAERTEVNRDGKAAKARLDAAVRHEDAPATETDAALLGQDLERRIQLDRDNDELRRDARQAGGDSERAAAEVRRLENALEAARAEHRATQSRATALAAQVAAIRDPGIAAAREALAAVEANNRKVRENREHARLAAEVDGLRERSKALSDRLAELASARAAQIAAAPFPVPGLGFAEDGTVTLNDLPFEQASRAEQLRVSVALGVASNPRLRVFFVRDGSLLDADNLRLVAELAREAGAQVWIEDARSTDPKAIIISDGTVQKGADDAPMLPGVER